MAEQLTVYTVGDRFATMATDGHARVYEVAADGLAYVCGYMPEPNDSSTEADRG